MLHGGTHHRQSIFDLPAAKFFLGDAQKDLSVHFHGQRASSPLGPAAGPQSQMAQNVADRAMQVFGGMGVCQDTMIPDVFTHARFCRIADGPDEVHMSQLAKLTIRELSG